MSTTTERTSPVRPAWAIGPHCEFLDVKPTRAVRISAAASRVIRDEFRDFYERRSVYGTNQETGGAAVGRRQVPGRDIEIVAAGTPGSDTETGDGWLRLGSESIHRLREEHESRGLVEVASWHSHPPGSSAQPSRADLRAWHSTLMIARERYGYQVVEYVGLIALPRGRGVDPSLHAWIVTLRGGGYATAEPAHLATTSHLPGTQGAPRSRRTALDRITLRPTARIGGVSTRLGANTELRADGSICVHSPMLVATRSFTADYAGDRVRITAGQSRVSKDHELARRSPSAWVNAKPAAQ